MTGSHGQACSQLAHQGVRAFPASVELEGDVGLPGLHLLKEGASSFLTGWARGNTRPGWCYEDVVKPGVAAGERDQGRTGDQSNARHGKRLAERTEGGCRREEVPQVSAAQDQHAGARTEQAVNKVVALCAFHCRATMRMDRDTAESTPLFRGHSRGRANAVLPGAVTVVETSPQVTSSTISPSSRTWRGPTR